MGTSRSRFLRAFFIESSVFQRNNHILRILFYFCAETLLASRTNHNATTETRKKKSTIFFLFLFFFYLSSIFCLIFRDFLLIMCSTLFERFLCPHRTTNIVSLDRNGNAISSFQSLGFGKLAVSSVGIVATSISSEIPMRVPCMDCSEGDKNWPLWGVVTVEI